MKIEFESGPDTGALITVRDGIEWARMPLPFALDHVNCWLLGDPGQKLLIDTGVDNDSTRTHWSSIFRHLGDWPEKLLVTHFHPDHIGLAGWFRENHCNRFLGSQQETALAKSLWPIDDDDYSSGYEQWYRANGLPEEVLRTVRKNGNTYCKLVSRPPNDEHWTFLQEGQVITAGDRQYTVMIGRGHAPDMIMLYRSDDHVLIAADQVLPFISPNVSVMPRLTDKNPLARFLSTLSRLSELPEDTLVLPSHGLPFIGLRPRLKALEAHHELRLMQVLEACREPRSAHDLFDILFRRKLDAQQTSFALGESLAHLHYLEHQGKLTRLGDQPVTCFLAT